MFFVQSNEERQKYSNQILSVIKLETYKVLSF